VDNKGHLPWHVWVSDFWVKGYKGYTGELREEGLRLGETLKSMLEQKRFKKLDSVWDRCLFLMKMDKWRQTEKQVEALIFDIIDASLKRRRIEDANMHAEDYLHSQQQHHIFSKRGLCGWLCWPCRLFYYLLCCRCCRKKKIEDGKAKKKSPIPKRRGVDFLQCCKVCWMCLKACILADLPQRPLPRHKRPNPYLQESFQRQTQAKRSPEANDNVLGARVRSKNLKEMTLEEHAKEAAAIEEDMIAKKMNDAENQKKRDLHHLMAILSQTDEFVREVEHCGGILDTDSMFWCYSWEFTLLIQKMLTVLVCSLAPKEQAQQVMSACMFFQVIVLIMCVDLEPFEMNLLNDVEMAMDIFMLYIVILAQLDWSRGLQVVSSGMIFISIAPLVMRMLLPSLPPDKEFDKAGNVVPVPKRPNVIELAVFVDHMGPNGMRRLKTVQRRIKKRFMQIHATQEEREEAAQELIKEKKIEKKRQAEYLGPTMRERIVELPKTLRGPVEAVAKVGWARIAWPSNFTAVHLAANAGHVEAINILHELGAVLTTADQWSLTPIDYAEQGGHDEVVRRIRELDDDAVVQRLPTRSRAGKAAKQLNSNNAMSNNFQDADAEPSPEKIGQPLEDREGERRPLMWEPPPKSPMSKKSRRDRDRGVVTSNGNVNVRGQVLKRDKQLPEHMAQRMSVWNEPGVQELMHKEVHGYNAPPESLLKQPSRTLSASGRARERPDRSERIKPTMSAPLVK